MGPTAGCGRIAPNTAQPQSPSAWGHALRAAGAALFTLRGAGGGGGGPTRGVRRRGAAALVLLSPGRTSVWRPEP